MRLIAPRLLIAFALSVASSGFLPAQSLTAEGFLKGVSARPAGDQVVEDQMLAVSEALNTATPAEVQRELPSIVQYALGGNEVRARKYALVLLNSIAIRPDGAALLFPSSNEISSLIVDIDPGIQKVATSIAFWAGPNLPCYVSAFKRAIKSARTPQDAGVQMVSSLARIGSEDPEALKTVLDFMHRDDLTVSSRIDLVHFLGVLPGLPLGINQALVKELDDPDPWVRAAAVASFADSKTEYHALAKGRVESMANDPQENPQVQEKAKEAIAGKSNLDPNIYQTPLRTNDH